MPLVSIVVPTHNRPEVLAEALATVRAQTFTDYEIIVVSNGESPDMCAKALAVAISFDARFFALPKGNLPAARNFAIGQAEGEWIAFLDDDDIWLPQKLESQLAAAKQTGADLIACDVVSFYPDGREEVDGCRVREGWSYTKTINYGRWGAPPSAVMIRKSVVLAVGGFDPQMRYREDIDLWQRVGWRHRIHQIGEPLIRYRRHAESMSYHRLQIAYYDLRLVLKTWRETPPDLQSTLPPRLIMIRRWLLRAITPSWMRQPRRTWEKLRTRTKAALSEPRA